MVAKVLCYSHHIISNILEFNMTFTEEVEKLIKGEKHEEYSGVRDNFHIVAGGWSKILEKEISSE